MANTDWSNLHYNDCMHDDKRNNKHLLEIYFIFAGFCKFQNHLKEGSEDADVNEGKFLKILMYCLLYNCFKNIVSYNEKRQL